MTLYTGSEATLDGTIVEAANSSSAQVQQGSTLNVLDGSTITLAQGQINVVAGNTATDEGSTLNLSDSSVSSAGTMSTIQGTNKAALNLTNATITHTNASGARYRPITPLPWILQAATLPLPVRACIFWRRTPGSTAPPSTPTATVSL
ncbi:host colonisation factor [Salmonella enterica subsp. enterica serovar Typhimurium]|nr:host colonisation factor [Salmonella enterica subsp. enterica serovar Typhimurium]